MQHVTVTTPWRLRCAELHTHPNNHLLYTQQRTENRSGGTDIRNGFIIWTREVKGNQRENVALLATRLFAKHKVIGKISCYRNVHYTMYRYYLYSDNHCVVYRTNHCIGKSHRKVGAILQWGKERFTRHAHGTQRFIASVTQSVLYPCVMSFYTYQTACFEGLCGVFVFYFFL